MNKPKIHEYYYLYLAAICGKALPVSLACHQDPSDPVSVTSYSSNRFLYQEATTQRWNDDDGNTILTERCAIESKKGHGDTQTYTTTATISPSGAILKFFEASERTQESKATRSLSWTQRLKVVSMVSDINSPKTSSIGGT